MFTDGIHVEHIWLSDLIFDGKKFHGKIGNEPLDIKKFSLGDHTEVLPSDISDWMIIEDNRLIGGYTIRVLRDNMSDNEKKEFDQKLPFIIE
jgi:uncharacterized protein YegJ (DUF2314 family)